MPNFRFGQPAHGNVYSRGSPHGRNATTRRRTTSNVLPSGSPATVTTAQQAGESGGYNINRFNPAYDRLEEGSVIEDWIPRDLAGINKMLRIIYARDAIAGPAVDIMAQLPWSEFDLHGIDDPKIMEFYEGAAQLFGDKAQEMPAITTEYLVLGRFCASLLYDDAKGYWTDFVPHDSDFLTITPIPVRGFDPKLDLMLSPGIRQFITSPDYRDQVAIKQLPDDLIKSMRGGGSIPLDPLATLYVRRKTSPYDHVGCVTADTLVHTNRGLMPIIQVPEFFETDDHDRAVVGAERCLRITGCMVPGQGSVEQATHWVDKGIQPLVRLQTNRGYELRGTLDHPVLVLNHDLSVTYKSLSDVVVGEYVGINRSSTQFADRSPRLPMPVIEDQPKGRCIRHELPRVMTPSLARVLGYLVAEGSVGEKIQFGNTDPDVMDDFVSSFREVFPDYGPRKGDDRAVGAAVSHTNRPNGMMLFNITRREVVAFLHGVGLRPGHAGDKRVPWSVMAAPKDCVSAFLSAYFEGDGSVRHDETCCGSGSVELIREIQILLLGFGIVGYRNVFTDYPCTINDTVIPAYSTLHLYSKEHDGFVDHIGFRSSRKQNMSTGRGERRSRTDGIPYLKDAVTEVSEERRTTPTARAYYDDTGELVRARLHVPSNSWLTAERLVPQVDRVSTELGARISALTEDKLFWDEVVDHGANGEERVYDLVVPSTKSFTANGLVNHNTSLYCVSGDSLVSTTKGLVRIDNIHRPVDEPVEVEKRLGVATTDGEIAKTSHWVYSGVSETIEVTTDYGYQVRGTPDHPVLTLNTTTLDIEWKKLRDVRLSDRLAIDLRSQVWPQEPRVLDDVIAATTPPSTRAVEHTLPRVMSDELALVLGYMVSEGHFGRRLEFGNMSTEVADDFERNFRAAFPTATLTRKVVTNGMTLQCCYGVHVLAFMRALLGDVSTKTKAIPDVILQSTRQHTASFLSAMFEGDGSVAKNIVNYYSSSPQLLKDLQILLTKFGLASLIRSQDRSRSFGECDRLTLQGQYRDRFLDEIGFRSTTKSRFTNRHGRCIVAELDTYDFVRTTLEARGQSRNGHYADDTGITVQNDIWSDNEQRRKVLPRNPETFEKFAVVSREAADKIRSLEGKGYFWQAITTLDHHGPEPVYDLCVPGTEAFVANGMVVHNTRIIPFWALEKALMNASVTAARRRAGNILHVVAGIEDKWEPTAQEMDDIAGLFIQADEDPVGAVVATRTGVEASEIRQGGDLWKWSDEFQTFAEGKMRGLGISEALLSGDATYNNMEQARSVFTEQVLQLRQHLTNQVYYRRFKTLARAHGFRKQSKANLDHRVRIRHGLNNLSHEEAMEIPEDDLIVPTIQWRKSLLPEGDTEYLELLETLKEQGIPIPLKVWAARGGYDLNEAMEMLEEDVELRKKIRNWEQKSGGGADEDDAFAEGEASPFWDRSQQFLQLQRSEAKRCLKEFVKAAREGHEEVLADHNHVIRTLHKKLGNDRKVELMAYMMMRMGLVQGLPVSPETIDDIATHFMMNEKLDGRRRHQELHTLARLTGGPGHGSDAAKNLGSTMVTPEVKGEVDRASSSEFLEPSAPTLLSGAS